MNDTEGPKSLTAPGARPRVSLALRVSALLLSYSVFFPAPIASFAADPEKPFHFIRAISIDPHDPGAVYVATENQGLLKSPDGGRTWRFINTGIKNYLIYDVQASLKTPGRVYAASWGGGIYQSDNGGDSWQESNDGLDNTAVGSVVLNMDKTGGVESIYIGTSTEVFERTGEDGAWRSITDGLSFWNNPQFQSLTLADTAPPVLYMGTEKGLYRKTLGAEGWTPVEKMKGIRISAVLYHPPSRRLFAGTLASGGIFFSRDMGRTWTASEAVLERSWIRAMAVSPTPPETLYAATTHQGVLMSRNGGRSWGKINRGLTDLDVRAFAVDPRRPKTLYAGTHGAGIFKSTDGGRSWGLLSGMPFQSVDRQRAALERSLESSKGKIAPPPAFKKCNACHGWTDPVLNQKPTYWRVIANRRKWEATVARMSDGTEILPEEQRAITAFLEDYTGVSSQGEALSPPSR